MAIETQRPGRRLTGGGTGGNEALTAVVGAVLLVLLAVLAITLVRMRQLIWLHLFLGLVLIGPFTVKIASTTYRFVRYYTHDPAYRRKGPPHIALRMLGPCLVVATVVVLASGVVLMLVGPAGRGGWLAVHKISFIVWGVLIAVHVIGHLPEMPRALRAAEMRFGGAGRAIVLGTGLVGGLLLATALIPDFAAWTGGLGFRHH